MFKKKHPNLVIFSLSKGEQQPQTAHFSNAYPIQPGAPITTLVPREIGFKASISLDWYTPKAQQLAPEKWMVGRQAAFPFGFR